MLFVSCGLWLDCCLWFVVCGWLFVGCGLLVVVCEGCGVWGVCGVCVGRLFGDCLGCVLRCVFFDICMQSNVRVFESYKYTAWGWGILLTKYVIIKLQAAPYAADPAEARTQFL